MVDFPPLLRGGLPLEELADDGDVLEIVCTRIEGQAVRRRVGSLPALERLVIAKRYGLCGPPASRRELESFLHLSSHAIAQIERRGMRQLRRSYAQTTDETSSC